MSTDRGFILDSIRVVAFTDDTTGFSVRSLLESISRDFASRFNGEPISLPLPDDAPAEVPRVIVRSADDSWRMQASPLRTDVVRQKPDGALDMEVAACVEVLRSYVESERRSVSRLSLVVARVREHNEPADWLIERFCSPEARSGPLRRSANFELHNHKVYLMPQTSIMVNSWVRCSCGLMRSEGEEKPAVVVVQDINTPPLVDGDEPLVYDLICPFYSDAANEMNSILSQYFTEA